MARKLNFRLEVLPTFRFCIFENEKKIYGGSNGISLSELRKYLYERTKSQIKGSTTSTYISGSEKIVIQYTPIRTTDPTVLKN